MPSVTGLRAALRWCAAHIARRAEWYGAPLFYALVVVWIYRDLWHHGGVATGFGWDITDAYGPDLDYVARELREGRFSQWNPWDKGGYPVVGDPQVDRYSPFNWPFVAWGALAGPSWWLIQIKALASHVAAASCMHLFLRGRGLPVRAAMVGGVALVASAPLLVHKASNILWPLAWVPLVWFAIDAAVARPTWRRGVGAGAAFALCATAGSPPGLFYAGLLIVPYAIFRVAAARPPLRSLADCAIAGAVVAGLVLAVAVLPTRELASFAARKQWGGGGAQFALTQSLPFGPAARGVFAFSAGLPEMYMGCAVALLAACALVARPRFDRGAAVLFCALAALGVVLAAGAHAGLLPWLVAHVPGFGELRIPGRYKLVTAWALAAAAAYGAAALDDATARRARVAAVAVIGAAAAIALVLHFDRAEPAHRAAWWSIAAAIAAAALIAGAVVLPARRGACGALLVLLVLFDAPWFVHTPRRPPASDPRQLHAGDAAILARLDGIRDRWRIYDEFLIGERAGTRHGVRDFRGYPAVDPLCQARYVDILEYLKRDPALLADFNVRYLLWADHFRFHRAWHFVRQPPPNFTPRGGGIYEARHPAELATWYGAIRIVDTPAAVLPAVRAVQEPDGARRYAVFEPAQAARLGAARDRLVAAPPASATARLIDYQPDAIELAIDAPREGIVVLAELTYPGWTVTVDGAPAEPLQANYLLRAVHVSAGAHQIRWRFEPRGMTALWLGYLLALAIALAAAVWPRRAARPR